MGAATRAAIYTRVSSVAQEDNSSLRTQEAECRAYAADRGWEIAGVYSDVQTGADLFERPGLSALRDAVRAGGIAVVLAHALNRLSRDQYHQAFLLSEWDHHGVTLALVTEDLDDSPEGRLLLAARGFSAAVERLKIRERTMRGRRDRIASGKPAVGPRPPYGYRWIEEPDRHGKPVKVRLEEAPETARIVRRIFAEIAGGSSARAVAQRLTDEGIPTPTGRQRWIGCTIIGMLKHPTYTGDAAAWRWKKEKVKGRGYVYAPRPASEHVPLPGAAPALIAPEIAAQARAQLSRNKQQAVRNNAHPEAFLLRGGIARCGYCGGALAGNNSRFGPLYRCHTNHRDRNGCPHFSIMAAKLDAAVWEGIRERLTRPDVIASELARLRAQDPTRGDLVAIERRLAEVARLQRNLMDRLASEDDADLAAMIRADLLGKAEEKRRLEGERADLDRQRAGWLLAQERLSELDLWVRNVTANLDEFDYAKRRLALSELGATVRVWATDHTPRWEVVLRPDALTASHCESSQTSL